MIYPTVQKVIDVLLEVDPKNFNMMDPKKCIAGQCKKLGFDDSMCCDDIFTAMTGITDQDIVRSVVYPDESKKDESGTEATLPQAIKMLETLRDEGKVDWDTAVSNVKRRTNVQ
jgi:hypothetical protein